MLNALLNPKHYPKGYHDNQTINESTRKESTMLRHYHDPEKNL